MAKQFKTPNSEELKELARELLSTVKTIAPALSKAAQETKFQITITNDEDGLGVEMQIGWDPTADPKNGEHVEEIIPIEESSIRIEEGEEELIRKALAITKGNRNEAAERLGFSNRTLSRKIKEYGL